MEIKIKLSEVLKRRLIGLENKKYYTSLKKEISQND